MNTLQMIALFTSEELKSFGVSNALLVSVIGIVVVLAELALLAGLIILISKLINKFIVKKDKAVHVEENTPTAQTVSAQQRGVKLNGVDEKTAAMIMAIVSNESKIPLDRLDFKSIKKVD